MRECSHGNDYTDGKPPPETGTSEYPSKAAANNESEFTELKKEGEIEESGVSQTQIRERA
jgi:hypothetical protein